MSWKLLSGTHNMLPKPKTISISGKTIKNNYRLYVLERTLFPHVKVFQILQILQLFQKLYAKSVTSFLKSLQKNSCSTSKWLGLHFSATVVQFHLTTFSLCLIIVSSCPRNVIIS